MFERISVLIDRFIIYLRIDKIKKNTKYVVINRNKFNKQKEDIEKFHSNAIKKYKQVLEEGLKNNTTDWEEISKIIPNLNECIKKIGELENAKILLNECEKNFAKDESNLLKK